MPLPACLRAGATLTATALLVALAGCGGGGGDDGPALAACNETARKEFVLEVARGWYLFDELLPATVNLDSFATAEDLLDHLTATAREQGKDRYFSYLTTGAAENALLGEGQFIGFGLRTRTDPVNRPFIIEVFESSPASEGGLQRGDEIVAVNSGSGYVSVSELLAGGDTISDVLGPPVAGVERGLRLLRNGVTRDVAMTKRTVTIDPVSDVYGTAVLRLSGGAEVGYFNLRTYVSTAESQLATSFAQFRGRGIDYFIVDLRYNGGGLVSIAELLNNLLGGARSALDVQMKSKHNARRAPDEDSVTRFDPKAQSVNPVRIAFLTTGGTASASEININSMTPWVEAAIVGEDTYGKPVGQYAFDLRGCPDRLRLVSFKTVNALDQGDYYDGLAGTVPFACAAEDTLEHPLGSASEGMTAAALHWLQSGSCPGDGIPTGAAKLSFADVPVDRYPRPAHPSAAQWWLPGVN